MAHRYVSSLFSRPAFRPRLIVVYLVVVGSGSVYVCAGGYTGTTWRQRRTSTPGTQVDGTAHMEVRDDDDKDESLRDTDTVIGHRLLAEWP